jgi:hypothetical protein
MTETNTTLTDESGRNINPVLAVRAFDESKPCYCNLCERWYKNYKRFYIHMKKHYC